MATQEDVGATAGIKDDDEFHAFISYSHQADRDVATMLRERLQRMGKPFYRRRAMKVFQDQSNLAAAPELWAEIVEGLSRSRWFVLVASPESAASPWVDNEVSWWLENRGMNTLLIVLTAGELRWDTAAGGYDTQLSTSLPPSLHGRHLSEPLWVDARESRESDLQAKDQAWTRDGVASLAAKILGISKDKLIGEDLRQHRRTRRAIISALASITVLAVGAVLAMVVALQQRNVAREQTELVVSRTLAGASQSVIDNRLDSSLLLAERAVDSAATPENRAALLDAVTASPGLRFLPAQPAPVTALYPVPGGGLVIGTSSGNLAVWDAELASQVDLPRMPAAVRAIAATADGGRLVAGDAAGNVAFYDVPGRQRLWSETLPVAVHDVAVSAKGRTVAATGRSAVSAWRAEPFEHLGTEEMWGEHLAFTGEDELLVSSSNGERTTFSVSSALKKGEWTFQISPANDYTAATSPNGRWYAYKKGSMSGMSDLFAAQDDPETFRNITFASDRSTLLAIDDRGERFAEATPENSMVVTRRRDPADPEAVERQTLKGFTAATTAVFTGDGKHLAAAGDRAVAVFRLDDEPQIAHVLPAKLGPVPCTACYPAAFASPDGSAVTWNLDEGLTCADAGTGEIRYSGAGGDPFGYSLNGAYLLARGEGGLEVYETDAGCPDPSTVRSVLPEVDDVEVVAPFEGQQVLVGAFSGKLWLIDLDSGDIVRTFSQMNLPEYPEAPVALDLVYLPVIHRLAALQQDGRVRWYDSRTGDLQAETEPVAGASDLPIFSEAVAGPEGRTLIYGTGEAVQEVTPEGDVVRTFPGVAEQLFLSRDGSLLIGRQDDDSVRLWDSGTGAVIGSLPRLASARAGIDQASVTSPAGKGALAVGADRVVLVSASARIVTWNVNVDDWREGACTTAARDLTEAEWNRFIGTDVPQDLRCSASLL